MRYTIHADGGARGNPGLAGAGALIRDELGNAAGAVSAFLGRQTNNYAEYEAVIRAFETLAELVPPAERTDTAVEVKMDSMLVVRQMQGEWKVKHPDMKAQQARLAQAIAAFGTVTFTHVPREQNKDADALANEAMDRGS
ncbi:MAG: ribonuclease HI family protein [Patescibacteria group bacterium]|nr:ribonuclease HI family protein [Patescibacteria group bacterium]MDE1944077.1 ribonuclease HI family protein [Patescibacteria group bacterium]MDE1944738.1 ribonuclease HI family protein [Patescibacteria group bacterium]MDE2057282.1 ribonuclease HI family protein [Patescibacteria group bacterium]